MGKDLRRSGSRPAICSLPGMRRRRWPIGELLQGGTDVLDLIPPIFDHVLPAIGEGLVWAVSKGLPALLEALVTLLP